MVVGNNDGNKEQDEKISYEKSPKETKDELYALLETWAKIIIQEKTYDKCVEDKIGCFLSLKSLEKHYHYDISVFTSEEMHCNVNKTGIYFNIQDNTPTISYFSLKDCYSGL